MVCKFVTLSFPLHAKDRPDVFFASIFAALDLRHDHILSSLQAKGTKSTSFLTHVRNEVDLIPLACEDDIMYSMR